MTEGNGRGVGGEGYNIHIIINLPSSLTLLPYMGEGNKTTVSGANLLPPEKVPCEHRYLG